MDVLENYKKAWENQPTDSQKLSKVQIYKMAHSKSSSIVKWIFIIGILEFIILNSAYFFIDIEEGTQIYKDIGIWDFVFYSQIVAYIVVFYFLIKFYLNYRDISVVDNTKTLMDKIVRTRKTVRNYVLFNLSYFLVIIIVASVATGNQQLDNFSSKQMLAFIIGIIIVTIIGLGLFWLFYQLLYGILLRKLRRNHKELAKLEELN